jgi:hypothetical protein
MSKQVIKNYIFDATAKTVTLPDFDTIDLSRLVLITNVTQGVIIYNFGDPVKGATISSNVITLSTSLAGMSNTDKLRVDYDTPYGDIAYDRVTVGNARNKFRDGFASATTQPNPGLWDLQNDDAGHIITQGGDSFGSSYLRVSLSPFVDNSGVTLTSKKTFKFPMRVGFGVSTSQRILGQEVFFGVVGTDASGNVDVTADIPDIAITGTTASITTNVGTFTIAGHGLKGGDRIEIEFCTDKRLNVGPAVVTVVDYNTITVPVTLANGTYSTVGGVVRIVDPLRNAKNGAGLLLENTNVGNASFVSKRNGSKFRLLNSTIGSTQATQSNTNPYTDAFNAAANQELYYSLDEVAYRSYTADGTGGMTGLSKFTQGIPDEDPDYKIQLRARNLTGITMPVAKIATIVKTTTTTATVTTTAAHGLAATDWVQIYGVADQTNFPNLAAQTQVASVVNSTTFTIVIGASTTGSSTGGGVWQVQGSILAPGLFGQVIQSISQTSQVLTVIGNSAWTAGLPGEYVHLYGMTGSAAAYDGAYKVLRVSGTTLEVQGTGANFGSITTGGAVIRRTDVRFHFARVMDYTRLVTEISGGKGNTSDVNNSVPVSITGAPSLSVLQSTGTGSSIWNSGGYGGTLAADVTSAAITTTTTTSAITPGVSPQNIGTLANSFNITVTAVSGTTPTMDVGVEESMDNGTNWIRVYDFPRITANGAYTSPLIRAQYGTRYRYVQTIGGTTPSFTRAVNRVMFTTPGDVIKQFFDRTIVLTTLNSTTPSYFVDGTKKFQLTANIGAVTTTAPQLQLEGSEDGASWYSIGAPLTAVASSTVFSLFNETAYPKFMRARVSTAGVGVTAGYVSIKALGA